MRSAVFVYSYEEVCGLLQGHMAVDAIRFEPNRRVAKRHFPGVRSAMATEASSRVQTQVVSFVLMDVMTVDACQLATFLEALALPEEDGLVGVRALRLIGKNHVLIQTLPRTIGERRS